MKSAQCIGLLLLGLTPAGCATIFSGSSQDFTVTATVVGAEVFLNDQLLGSTPLTVSIKRGQTGMLRVVKEGYETWEVPLKREINAMVWLNILSLGPFDSSTDYATGAWRCSEAALCAFIALLCALLHEHLGRSVSTTLRASPVTRGALGYPSGETAPPDRSTSTIC